MSSLQSVPEANESGEEGPLTFAVVLTATIRIDGIDDPSAPPLLTARKGDILSNVEDESQHWVWGTLGTQRGVIAKGAVKLLPRPVDRVLFGLFEYVTSNDDEVSFKEHEELNISYYDYNSEWALAFPSNGGAPGLVPKAYLYSHYDEPQEMRIVEGSEEVELLGARPGAVVNVVGADESGEWCVVTYEGRRGRLPSAAFAPYDRSAVKNFVIALFDFVGESEHDLSFKTGELIELLIVQKDTEWGRGMCHGVPGLFPLSFTRPYDPNESFLVRVSKEYNATSEKEISLQAGELVTVVAVAREGWYIGVRGSARGLFPMSCVTKWVGEKVKAVRTFRLPGAGPGELAFAKGDVITVLEKRSTGWWEGSLNGHVGSFPRNFVVPVVDDGKGGTVRKRRESISNKSSFGGVRARHSNFVGKTLLDVCRIDCDPRELYEKWRRDDLVDGYVASHVTTKEKVCLREIRVVSDEADQVLAGEITAWKQFSHPCICRFIDAFLVEGWVWVVSEYRPGQLVADVIETRVLTEAEAVNLARNMVDVMCYLHSLDIVLLNLSTHNIWMGTDGEFIVKDLHTALRYEEQDFVADMEYPQWMAPELVRPKRAVPVSDVWGLGVTLHTVLTGTVPYANLPVVKLLYSIVSEGLPPLMPAIPVCPELLAFVEACTVQSPLDRATSGDLRSHPLFSSLRWTRERHSWFPPSFRRAATALFLARTHATEAPELSCLPIFALELVLEWLAAVEVSEWVQKQEPDGSGGQGNGS